MDNPFAGASGERLARAPATALVIFGATGDLTLRKLIPALCNLAQDDYLPTPFVVVGASRREIPDEQYRQMILEGIREHSRRKIEDKIWQEFSENVFYHQVRFDNQNDYHLLKERLDNICRQKGGNLNFLYYLATSPSYFGLISENLHQAGLVESTKHGLRRTSVIVEKPFGHDLDSAKRLNLELKSSFEEKQIFRIDHYLGKETVQNILVFRFANGIFEPLWNYRYIDHIQISVAENVGIGRRGEYFDKTGIVRDIAQNHILQVLSLLCIEPPVSFTADSVRDEKVKVLKSIRRFTTPQQIETCTIRGQYIKGYINNQAVRGYTEEDGVAKNSTTETFAALRLEIDNWRWAGVPIYIRTGKRLPKRITEISVLFKRPPDILFKNLSYRGVDQNVLAIQIQPREGISLKICSKPPGPRLRAEPVVMEFNYGHSFGVPSPEAYERLLLDAMKGDATLFTRDDEIEEAWDILDPVLHHWETKDSPPLYTYEAGTWGPKEAANLLKSSGRRWRRL
ncbi:MAG: glucose-6-phosphate dehydrogenase [Candidatus Dadabacteria bacterium]|nr:MAG: glucose-6-phosphate dehydrogenase [Candidatus Dadabacteria bacterium]